MLSGISFSSKRSHVTVHCVQQVRTAWEITSCGSEKGSWTSDAEDFGKSFRIWSPCDLSGNFNEDSSWKLHADLHTDSKLNSIRRILLDKYNLQTPTLPNRSQRWYIKMHQNSLKQERDKLTMGTWPVGVEHRDEWRVKPPCRWIRPSSEFAISPNSVCWMMVDLWIYHRNI